MSRDQLNPLHGDQLSKSDATDRIRRECSQCANEQGGTELSKNYGSDETALPAGDASGDIADGGYSDNGMGRAQGEWQTRDDDDNHMDY